MSRPNQPDQQSLTDREQEILRLLATGCTDREIAEILVLTVGTVKWYNRQIYSKLGVRNRVEAVAQAQEQALLGNAIDRFAHTSTSKKTHNLPAQTTAFVGREAELSELARLLNDPQLRLVTIVASGGMGKTRLALEVAEQLIENFANGVYLVELAPLSDPNNIVSAIAEATDYQFQPDEREPKQQILDFLANNTMLLVMDNYEHLIEGASLMTDILNVAPNVQILATSRQRLNQPGEIVFNLAGLDSPEWKTPEDTPKNAGLKLFTQSAKQVQLQFEVTADNVNEVVRICMLVQGMPLGILLAASWIALLSSRRNR